MTPDHILKTISAENAAIPDIRELLAHIHRHLGGTQSYAAMIVEDVQAAPAGSTQRMSFHNNYLGAVAKFGGNDDLDNADPETLQAEALALAKQLGEANGKN